MVKVIVQDDGGTPLRISVVGKLTSAWTGELEACWRAHLGREIIVDLSEVDYADTAGRYLLAWMQSAGVHFITPTLPMQDLLAGVRDPSHVPRRRSHHRLTGLILSSLMCLRLGAAEPLTLTLRRAVEIASSPEGSARIQIADESVRQADARSKQQRAALLPNVEGYVAFQNQTRNLAAFGIQLETPFPGFHIPTFVGPFSTLDVRATLTQSVFDYATIKRYQSSKVAVSSAKADRLNTSDQVAVTVVRAYLTALKADADVEAVQADVDLAEAVLKQVQQQKAAGTGVGIEVTRARVQLANERQRLLVANNDQRKGHLNLLRAVGLRLDTQIQLDGKLTYEPVSEVTLANATKRALSERSDYKSQQERERSTELSGAATKWERLPSLAALGDYGNIGTDPSSLLPTRTIGFQLRVPVFDGGRRDYRRAEAVSQTRQERTRTRDLHEQIELEVRLALDSLASARDQVEVAQEGLTLSQDELASARRRYSAGVSTSVEITDAQTRLERARNNYVAALYAWNLARVDLAQAQGVIQEVVK